MRFRWKLLLLLLGLSLGPMLLMRLGGVHAVSEVRGQLGAQVRESLTQETADQLALATDFAAVLLERMGQALAVAMRHQVDAAERVLVAAPPAPSGGAAPAFEDDEGTPPGAALSRRHVRLSGGGRARGLLVDPGAQVFRVLPGTGAEDAALMDQARRLMSMTPDYAFIAGQIPDLVLWQKTVLEDGLSAAYPWHRGIPEDYDPRRDAWYLQALAADGNTWSAPLPDPVTGRPVLAISAPVRVSGKVVGVTAMILNLSAILDLDRFGGKLPGGTRSFLVAAPALPSPALPSPGAPGAGPCGGQGGLLVLASGGGPQERKGWRHGGGSEVLCSDDTAGMRAVMGDIAAGRRGSRRMPMNGQDSLWTYAAIGANAAMLVAAPMDSVLAPAVAAEARAQAVVDGTRTATAAVFSLMVLLVLVAALFFARTVTRPVQALAEAARRLAGGDFAARVDVVGRDEFGEMGRVFNAVGPELAASARQRQGLAVAEEVQQSLLPHDPPRVAGLGVAARCLYCDETGGDYFDYLPASADGSRGLGVAVGDVTGHGVAAALLMASGRAYLRQRWASCSGEPGALAALAADVNESLCLDVGDSGRFLTLFLLRVDGDPARGRRLTWVRAGHDPAYVFDPASGAVEELKGPGIALGVFPGFVFSEESRPLRGGEIVVIGTDGIWEAHDAAGEMFGKERFVRAARERAHREPAEIVDGVMEALASFLGGVAPEDDATLVVLKVDG